MMGLSGQNPVISGGISVYQNIILYILNIFKIFEKSACVTERKGFTSGFEMICTKSHKKGK
jgi:hypothetical protein